MDYSDVFLRDLNSGSENTDLVSAACTIKCSYLLFVVIICFKLSNTVDHDPPRHDARTRHATIIESYMRSYKNPKRIHKSSPVVLYGNPTPNFRLVFSSGQSHISHLPTALAFESFRCGRPHTQHTQYTIHLCGTARRRRDVAVDHRRMRHYLPLAKRMHSSYARERERERESRVEHMHAE